MNDEERKRRHRESVRKYIGSLSDEERKRRQRESMRRHIDSLSDEERKRRYREHMRKYRAKYPEKFRLSKEEKEFNQDKRRVAKQEHYEANKEEIDELNRVRRSEKNQRTKDAHRLIKEQFPEKHKASLAKKKVFREANADKIKAYQAEYRSQPENMEYAREYWKAHYQARKKGVPIGGADWSLFLSELRSKLKEARL